MNYASCWGLRAIALLAVLAASVVWPANCEERMIYQAFLNAARESLHVLVVAEGPQDGAGCDKELPGRLLVFWGSESAGEDPGPSSPNMAAHVVVSPRNEGPGQAFNLYIPTEVQFADLDNDGISEIISWWRSGPYDAYYATSLAVTKYDPCAGTFVTFAPSPRYETSAYFVSELGGFYVEQVGDGTRIIRYAPVTRSDEPDGVECLLCRHRFKITVLQLTVNGLEPDLAWNQGEPLMTEIKYYPYETGRPEINRYVHNPAYSLSAPGDRAGLSLIPPLTNPLGLPFSIAGEVSSQVQALLVEIIDSNGVILLLDTLSLSDKEPGGGARFEEDIFYDRPTAVAGQLRFHCVDADSLEFRAIASFPVVFSRVEDVYVTVYFANPQFDALTRRTSSCVYPVWRRLPRRGDLEEAAIEQLLRGPTYAERIQGYVTCLPATRARIYFGIEEGVAGVFLYDTGWDPVGLEWIFWDPSPADDALGEEQLRCTLLQFTEIQQVYMRASWRPGDL